MKIICWLFGHKFKFDHLRNTWDQWWVGTDRVEFCERCDKKRIYTFGVILTKKQTYKYKPVMIHEGDRFDKLRDMTIVKSV